MNSETILLLLDLFLMIYVFVLERRIYFLKCELARSVDLYERACKSFYDHLKHHVFELTDKTE